MSKFKVGDTVKVVSDNGISNIFPIGTVGTVVEVRAIPMIKSSTPIGIFGRISRYVSDCDLELVEEANIHKAAPDWEIRIFPNGDDTIIHYYRKGKFRRASSVRRYYKDKYDTFIAATEAVKKLFGKQDKPIEQTEPEKPKGFTGRALYTGTLAGGGFTAGKIYKFDNGRAFDDNGEARPTPQSRIEPTNLEPGQWGGKVFVKIVE